jgi:cell division septum initiation protein DivIVA
MLQEAEKSTSNLLEEAEQMLQVLEEEAKESWEDRTAHHASRMINLAGKASEALDETRCSRRDSTEYQDELDWEMRAFRRVCSDLRPSEMPSKIKRAAGL